MQKSRRIKLLVGITLITIFIFILLLLIYRGTIRPNRILVSKKYSKGVDLSHYQGNVDMNALAEQGIDFIYIKATEGSSFVDDHYSDNNKNAMETRLLTGAYHFFSFDSDGETQAKHFIQTIGNQKGKLIPAVDVEYYGDKRKNPPDLQDVQSSLKKCLDVLEEEYQCKPVIYTTLPFYNKYIRGDFEEYPLWIRNVYFPANIFPGKHWTFWQYDDKTIWEAYQGGDRYIDVNVFHGDQRELEQTMVIQ